LHINIAISDPIYEGVDTPKAQHVSFLEHKENPADFTPSKLPEIQPNESVLILIGQHHVSDELSKSLKLIEAQTPILTDVCSQQFQLGLSGWDAALLSNKQDASLVPDVLITMGMATISKPLKSLFRTHKPKRHLHISTSTEVGDPFQTQPEIVQFDEVNFLNEFKFPSKPSKLLKSKWEQFISGNPIETNGWSLNFQQEFQWVRTFMKQLNEHDILHLGNSMAVRYGSWAGTCKAQIYSNRGISGIDGCLSTAIGFAKSCEEKNVYLIIGDVSAIYDAHGLWTDIPSNLKVIVLNNKGGKIFDWIKGPNDYPPLKKYIQTPQDKDFSKLAAFYGIPHMSFSISEIDASINTILGSNNKGAFLIELCSD
jgi:2-succinyl-5-enolpyruvyl-6-hydroxy-3-cyclohexene-1-carboxylate synthase